MIHKHDGYLTSTGEPRSHPIERLHKKQSVRNEHNKSLSKKETMYILKPLVSKAPKREYVQRTKRQIPKAKTSTFIDSGKKKLEAIKSMFGVAKPAAETLFDPVGKDVEVTDKVICQIDRDGYINIDVDSLKQKGVRLKLTRKEGRTKRTVGITFNRI